MRKFPLLGLIHLFKFYYHFWCVVRTQINDNRILNIFSIASSPMPTNLNQPSPDEILIDFLIENPCLWDKSDHDFRNRNLKDFKWKEVASRINMAGKRNSFFLHQSLILLVVPFLKTKKKCSNSFSAHEAIRRYKTLCERFRREMIKQSSIPNFVSSWNLFNKFAALKDAQSSEDRKIRIKTEDPYDHDVIDFSALAAEAAAAKNVLNSGKKKRKSSTQRGCNDSIETTNGNDTSMGNGNYAKIPRLFDNHCIDDDNDTIESMNVQPSFIGGSTDLSTDTIAAFCQFVEASLKQMPSDRSDDLIEEISLLLFRKKREFKTIDENNENNEMASPPSS